MKTDPRRNKDLAYFSWYSGRPLILASDRDSGLWIFRYTGKE